MRSYHELNVMLKGAMTRVRANNPDAFHNNVTEKLPLCPTDELVVSLAEALGFQTAWLHAASSRRRRPDPPASLNIMGALRQGKDACAIKIESAKVSASCTSSSARACAPAGAAAFASLVSL